VPPCIAGAFFLPDRDTPEIRHHELLRATAERVSAPAPAPMGSVADELKKLVELRDAGVLDANEFAAQKAKLLGS
jgi:hypothetical protein